MYYNKNGFVTFPFEYMYYVYHGFPLNNQTWSVILFNRLAQKSVVSMICNMKPCNITSRSLSIALLSESNKTTVQI